MYRGAGKRKLLSEQFAREQVPSVKAEQNHIFLGRRITPQLARKLGYPLASRIEGACIKHRFGKYSIKMYDKFGIVPRIEFTTNHVRFF